MDDMQRILAILAAQKMLLQDLYVMALTSGPGHRQAAIDLEKCQIEMMRMSQPAVPGEGDAAQMREAAVAALQQFWAEVRADLTPN